MNSIATPILCDDEWSNAFRHLLRNKLTFYEFKAGFDNYFFQILQDGKYLHFRTVYDGKIIKDDLRMFDTYYQYVWYR